MKKLGIIAHFGFGKNLTNGQTIKSQIFFDSMKNYLGDDKIETVDTHGGIKHIFFIIYKTIKLFSMCDNIVILPADKGLRLLLPLTCICNFFYHRKLIHIVIGGWLPEFLEDRKFLKNIEKRFTAICVETNDMMLALKKQGFANVLVLPNCKNLKKINPDDLKFEFSEPFHLCTFSRVMREKGIEIAIDAVTLINKQLNRNAFQLDIYGEVWNTYIDEFNRLMSIFPDYIRYMGVANYDESVEILNNYSALLFPTYYEGEGFAGTLIDAMAAGVPVIASNWKYNNEIVIPGRTGVLVNDCDAKKIADILLNIVKHPKKWNSMKTSCLLESEKYDANVVYQKLLEVIEI